jgi:hypothetical protein
MVELWLLKKLLGVVGYEKLPLGVDCEKAKAVRLSSRGFWKNG